MLILTLLGFALVGVTVAIHGAGTYAWMQFVARRYSGRDAQWGARENWQALMLTAIVLLGLHTVEVVAWALTYLWLPAITALETFEAAVYFSLVTFTTLGYGDITLEPGPRFLSGIEAMNGILLFGWSTALFFAVLQRSWQARHKSV